MKKVLCLVMAFMMLWSVAASAASNFVAMDVAPADAEGVAEFNKVDYMHLTRKGHADLAKKLSEMVPQLVK